MDEAGVNAEKQGENAAKKPGEGKKALAQAKPARKEKNALGKAKQEKNAFGKAKQEKNAFGKAKQEKKVLGKEEQEKDGTKKPGKAKMALKPAWKAFFDKNALLISIALAAIITAASLIAAFQPGKASVEDFWPKNGLMDGEGEVNMIIIISNRCPGCQSYNGNSLENLFNANGIAYAIKEYEESSQDGQSFIAALGIKKLPAYIIDGQSLNNSMQVQVKSGGKAPLKDVLEFYVSEGNGSYEEDIFVFPEMSLDGILRPSIRLREQCGNETDIWLQMFLDPYDPNYIKRSDEIEALRGILSSEPGVNANIQYSYLPTYSNKFLDMNFGFETEDDFKDYINGAAAYVYCAEDFGNEKFEAMQHAVYSTYCGIDENANSSDYKKGLQECSQSSHYDIPLTEEELEEAESKAGLDPELRYSACTFAAQQGELENMVDLAKGIGINRTPTFLVNCIYEVPFVKVLPALCLVNQELSICAD